MFGCLVREGVYVLESLVARLSYPSLPFLFIHMSSSTHRDATENRYYDPVHDLMRQWGLVKEDLVE